MATDPRLWDPDPDIRFQAWRELATNAGITNELVERLAHQEFGQAATGLAAAIGKPADHRGAFLGGLESWGLDVYENSPQEWKTALIAEYRKERGHAAQ